MRASKRSEQAERQRTHTANRLGGTRRFEIPLVRWEHGELRWYETKEQMAEAPFPPEALSDEPPAFGCMAKQHQRPQGLREHLDSVRRR